MPEPIRHALSEPQKKALAQFEASLASISQARNAYLQAIVDGVDSPDSTLKWALEGGALVGTPNPPDSNKE